EFRSRCFDHFSLTNQCRGSHHFWNVFSSRTRNGIGECARTQTEQQRQRATVPRVHASIVASDPTVALQTPELPDRGVSSRASESLLGFTLSQQRSTPLQAADFITFPPTPKFLFPFSAQKSHVKPPNHLNHSNETK